MGQQLSVRIEPARRLLRLDGRELLTAGFDLGELLETDVLLQQQRLEARPSGQLVETFEEGLVGNAQDRRQAPELKVQVLLEPTLAPHQQVDRRPGGGQHFAMMIEDVAAGRRDRDPAQPVVLGQVGVLVAVDALQVPEVEQEAEQEQEQAEMEQAQPALEALADQVVLQLPAFPIVHVAPGRPTLDPAGEHAALAAALDDPEGPGHQQAGGDRPDRHLARVGHRRI